MSFGSLLQQQQPQPAAALLRHPAELLPPFQPSNGAQTPSAPSRPLLTSFANPTNKANASRQSDSPRTPVQRAISDSAKLLPMGGAAAVGYNANGPSSAPAVEQNPRQSVIYASPLPSRPTPAETLLRRKTPGGGMVIGGFDAAPPMHFPGGSGVVQLDGAPNDAAVGRPRKHILLANAGLLPNNIGAAISSNPFQYQTPINNNTPFPNAALQDLNEPLTPTNQTFSTQTPLSYTSNNENLRTYNVGQQQQQPFFPAAGSVPQITDLSRIPAASGSAHLQGNFAVNAALQHEPLDDSAFPSRSNNATPVQLDFHRRQSLTPTFPPSHHNNALPMAHTLQQQQLQHQQFLLNHGILPPNHPALSYPQLGALVQDGGPMPAVLGFNSPAPAWSPSANLGVGIDGGQGLVTNRQLYVYPPQMSGPIVAQQANITPYQQLSSQMSHVHLPLQGGAIAVAGKPFQKSPLSSQCMERDAMLTYCNDAYMDLITMKQQQTAMYGKGRIQPIPRHIGLTTKSITNGIWRHGAKYRPELQRYFSDPTAAAGALGARDAYTLPVGNTIRSFDPSMHREPESVASASKRRRLNSFQDEARPDLMAIASRQQVPYVADMPSRRFGLQQRASSMTSIVDMRRRQQMQQLQQPSDVRILRADPPMYQPRYDQQAAFHAQHSPNGSPIAMQPSNIIPAQLQIANNALEMLEKQCAEDDWTWLEGMLLAGCLSYALGDIKKARLRYEQIIDIDPTFVEALANLGSTALSMGNKMEAERFWVRAVKHRPAYFEAVEHLVSLLCSDKRTAEAVTWIDYVESSIRRQTAKESLWANNCSVDSMSTDESNGVISMSSPQGSPDGGVKDGDYVSQRTAHHPAPPSSSSSNTSNGIGLAVTPLYMIPPVENGRLLQLIHAKGNMLYSMGQNLQAAKAFEDAVLLGTLMSPEGGIEGLIARILDVLSVAVEEAIGMAGSGIIRGSRDPLLLSPDRALRTAKLLFPPHGELPGLKHVAAGHARKAAINTTSNSLLSLAKIYQDAISAGKEVGKAASSVRDILALYYLSLALHPSPSTANNVGILLASVQQSSPLSVVYPLNNPLPQIPGLAPGSGVALALGYYYYGLHLDPRHAHLYTNLGSLLKDMGNLPAAIKMYEQAVDCDGRFDIALANLANAVKDQGHVADAIRYYKRAVEVNPDFAEAVCGLSNALNSVCDWFGRGGVVGGRIDRWHVGADGLLVDSKGKAAAGWMRKVVEIVERQLAEGREWGKGVFSPVLVEALLGDVQRADSKPWSEARKSRFRAMLERWKGQSWQGAKLVQLVERISKKLVWRWYQDLYVDRVTKQPDEYKRPTLPGALSVPNAPTVLPFHTFTCPLSVSQVRMISQRNGLRISCSTLKSPWLPPLVARPPRPPAPALHVGYVSSDFNNHPLAHLMQSVFGFHDPKRVKAFCYATSASDGSQHRQKIEREAPVFRDAASWNIEKLVRQIQDDGIHVLVNLNGFTRGARNEVFAAKPAPLQMSFMGFAGTLGAEWCDYIYADETAVPRAMLRPWARDASFPAQEAAGGVCEWEGEDYEEGSWVYGENVIYSQNTFFCTDHKQSSPDSKDGQLSWVEEQARRWRMRKLLFPELGDDKVILGNFNQLYKIEPTTFRTWLRILMRVPNAILWLLRFPDLGEANLLRFARLWAGEEVASRIIFTDVAAKDQHISRARVCDLFLDTPECNAHTTAADVLWSGSPLLTFPRHEYKMCSRIAASIVRSAVPDDNGRCGRDVTDRLVVDSEEMYEERAVELAESVVYTADGMGSGELVEMRKALVMGRWKSALFDTQGWVRSLEQGYWRAWEKWVKGERGDIDL
ncbi:hypothetical protein Dda_6867 [Drechslerella dactyloides]|uniref:protein O-GlcNAc transferase n=1 Tax=Drechslerella dactyloides TaxID=74499 RepID=A0AAD6IUA7_DREDA|nr:hypothetical protein Dda_6867 [Drechslerella dactyloides]